MKKYLAFIPLVGILIVALMPWQWADEVLGEIWGAKWFFSHIIHGAAWILLLWYFH